MENQTDLKRQVGLIKTQTYFNEVKQRSGGQSYGKLQKRFLKRPWETDDEFTDSNSRVFYKYASGETILKNVKLVSDIEREFPGTKMVFTHPLWFILENPLSDFGTLDKNFRKLDPDIHSILFKKDHETNTYVRKELREQRRPRYYIDLLNNLDTLLCFLMIIKESEIQGKWVGCIESKWFALGTLLRLSLFAPLNKVAYKLYNIIDEYFIGENYSSILECNLLFSKEIYYSPPFLDSEDFQSMRSKLSNILLNAKRFGLEESDKQSQLKFLSWAFLFGLEKTYNIFNAKQQTAQDQEFIHQFFLAYKSTSPKKHLPNYYVLDPFLNYQ